MVARYTIATKKAPNPVDKHVGGRVRMRRKMLAMSQTQLADALGLTFQQVQKYEKGTNRMGASRLQQMSDILQVPVESSSLKVRRAHQRHTAPMEARYRWSRLMTSSPIQTA